MQRLVLRHLRLSSLAAEFPIHPSSLYNPMSQYTAPLSDYVPDSMNTVQLGIAVITHSFISQSKSVFCSWSPASQLLKQTARSSIAAQHAVQQCQYRGDIVYPVALVELEAGRAALRVTSAIKVCVSSARSRLYSTACATLLSMTAVLTQERRSCRTSSTAT